MNSLTTTQKAIARLNTPQLLKGGLYLTWGASVLVLIATIAAVQGQRYAIKTIGKDTAPSIIAAQQIKSGLADLDANAANKLLVEVGKNPEAEKAYDDRRKEVVEASLKAAENITYGDAERVPIRKLFVALGDYRIKIHEARIFQKQKNEGAILAAYRAGADIIDNTLLSAADDLDRANREALDRIYREQKFAAGKYLFFVLISGLGLVGVLVALQIFLNARMRRLLNPMLLAATAIAVLFVGYTVRALSSASYELKVAKEDAFESIHALWQIRALANSANGDESRYLLDAAKATEHEQAFSTKLTKLAQIPDVETFKTIVSELKRAGTDSKADAGFKGLFADELNNITFKGEREAAIETLEAFGKYFEIDRQIRQLQESGKHDAAVALCIGNKQGESNWAFDRFDRALDKTLEVNQQAFDRAVEKGFKEMDGFEITTPIALGAIALLTLFGLLPRTKEYTS
ncbi:hypothetical protein V2H45_07940 [Tumidithrix elongata RA019]|uniref:Uncharacterized protein n=1 Tax=Tumidithrix elongata BACA0141 TaxID=2716417 RepID=A0AAW9PV50_9CYAN|nr:hypothetical protein [Tumidithrix elongata RA019]